MNTRKIFLIIILIAFVGAIGVIIFFANKGNDKNLHNNGMQNTKVDIEITDNFFIEQTNDIYLNINDYIGKTIKIEGLIYPYIDDDENIYYAVVRNTPGCCGNDGLAGVDIRYNGDYPKEDTWVEVIGTLGIDIVYGNEIPAIQVSKMNIKEKGKTFVNN